MLRVPRELLKQRREERQTYVTECECETGRTDDSWRSLDRPAQLFRSNRLAGLRQRPRASTQRR